MIAVTSLEVYRSISEIIKNFYRLALYKPKTLEDLKTIRTKKIMEQTNPNQLELHLKKLKQKRIRKKSRDICLSVIFPLRLFKRNDFSKTLKEKKMKMLKMWFLE